jgi:hypothetical protein
VILPDELATRIERVPDLLLSRQGTTLIVRGMHGCGRRTLLGTLARMLGRSVLLWEGGKSEGESWSLLGPLATLTCAMPVLRCEPGQGETLELPQISGYNGPVGIACGRDGGLRGPLVAHSLSVILPPPDASARRRFWQAAQVSAAPATLDMLVGDFLLTGGNIVKTATLARAYAILDGRSEIIAPDVRQAARVLNRQALETLATELEPMEGWNSLVVSPTMCSELRTLEAHCRGRETLRSCTGPALSRSLNRGVRIMFSGPSGTGKTLAARALAGALHMDLYRVDLAAVVNKYIGETERNLNQVFSRAEELDVLLLLDEGDALMASRTDVRNANDRYANLETNYLLQRLENYEGIVVITTNAAQRIDNAFLRRLDAVIDFTPPDAPERLLIWQSHLPAANRVSAAFLTEIAGRCELTGGQIRNATLRATLLAAGDGTQVNDSYLEAAVLREYHKAGASYPLHQQTNTYRTQGQVEYMRRFTAHMS